MKVDGPMDEWNFLPTFMEKYSQLMPIVIVLFQPGFLSVFTVSFGMLFWRFALGVFLKGFFYKLVTSAVSNKL